MVAGVRWSDRNFSMMSYLISAGAQRTREDVYVHKRSVSNFDEVYGGLGALSGESKFRTLIAECQR